MANQNAAGGAREFSFAENTLARLYLQELTADVHFLFEQANDDDDGDEMNTVKIPAHKLLLCTASPVFRSMLHASPWKNTEVHIVDASADAFKEFLQFFYLTRAHFKLKNIMMVAYLCKKYQIDDECISAALRDFLPKNIDALCANYETVRLLELEDVVSHCERLIMDNATTVLHSTSFLDCNRHILKRILQLVSSSSKCNALTIVSQSLAWAKAECDRIDLPPTMEHQKSQLKHVIDLIPFAVVDADDTTNNSDDKQSEISIEWFGCNAHYFSDEYVNVYYWSID